MAPPASQRPARRCRLGSPRFSLPCRPGIRPPGRRRPGPRHRIEGWALPGRAIVPREERAGSSRAARTARAAARGSAARTLLTLSPARTGWIRTAGPAAGPPGSGPGPRSFCPRRRHTGLPDLDQKDVLLLLAIEPDPRIKAARRVPGGEAGLRILVQKV